MVSVTPLNPRARAWLQVGHRWGWSERVYLAPASADPAFYARLASAWAAARAALLGPWVLLGRVDVSLRDTCRDGLWVKPPAPWDPKVLPVYDPALWAQGPTAPAMVRVNEKAARYDGLYHSQHPLGGVPQSLVGQLRPPRPGTAWYRNWLAYRALLLGADFGGAGASGLYGFKAARKPPEGPGPFAISGATWAGGLLSITAPGAGVPKDAVVYVSLMEGEGANPNQKIYVVQSAAGDTFTVPFPVQFTWRRGGRVRQYVYDFVPYQTLSLTDVISHDTEGAYDRWTWANLGPVPAPVNPCGMCVAWGRGPPYKCKMRFFRDSDVACDVQWQVCQPGAKDFPLYNVFSSSLYVDRPSGPWSYPGEVEGTRQRSGVWHYSNLPGTCHMGTDDQWAFGPSVLDPVPPPPPCCLPPEVVAQPPVEVGVVIVISVPTMTLTVDQYTGAPVVTDVTQVDFDFASGLAVQVRGPGDAGVTLVGATETQPGSVTTEDQRWAGAKTFTAVATVEGAQAQLNLDDGPLAHLANISLRDSPYSPQGFSCCAQFYVQFGSFTVTAIIDPGSGAFWLKGVATEPAYCIIDAEGNHWRGYTGTAPAQFLGGIAVVPLTPSSSSIVGLGGLGAGGAASINHGTPHALAGHAGLGAGGAAALAHGHSLAGQAGLAAGGAAALARGHSVAGAAGLAAGGSATLAHGAGPTVLLLDHFTASDGSSLPGHVPDVGPAWPTGTEGWFIDSDQATQQVSDGSLQTIADDSGQSDVTVSVTFTPPSAGSFTGGVCFRWTDASNWLICNLTDSSSGSVNVYRTVAGTTTQIGGQTAMGTFAGPQALKVVLSGPTISVYLDGTHLYDVTESFNETATRHGLYNALFSGWGQCFWDDFQVTTP